jgi:cytochrome P450
MTRPPGPKGQWLSGHLSEFRGDILSAMKRWQSQFGETILFRFGPYPVHLYINPDAIHEVFVTKHRNFIKSPGMRMIKDLIGNGLLLNEGESWVRQRRLMQPAFHRERISMYGNQIVQAADRMLAGWRPGEERELHEAFNRLTLGIAAETLFGADLSGAAEKVTRAVTFCFAHYHRRLSGLEGLLPHWIPTPENLRFWRAKRELDGVVAAIITERRHSGSDRQDLLSMLLQARDEDGSGMTEKQVRDEVITLLLAGHETTSNALVWACSYLAQHADIKERLAAELTEVLGDRLPTTADLPALRYTEMVLKETLRLCPPAWSTFRQALAACEIGGYPVKKGGLVMISPWLTHRHPDIYPDPEVFRPERWEGDLERQLPPGAYIPFGAGPRLCIGRAFATVEANLLLAAIFQRFHLTLAPGGRIEADPSITLRPKYGVRVHLQARG